MANYSFEINKFDIEKTARLLGVEPSKVFLWRIIQPFYFHQIYIKNRLYLHKTDRELKELQAFLRLCKKLGATKVSYDEDKNIDLYIDRECRELENHFIESNLPFYGWMLWLHISH